MVTKLKCASPLLTGTCSLHFRSSSSPTSPVKGATSICLACGPFPCVPHDICPVYLVVQGMKPALGICLSRKVKGSLEFSNFSFGVVSRFRYIYSLLPPLIPVNKVRVLSSRRLCCPAFTGTTTLSDSLLATCHFTLRAYRFALYGFHRAEECLPSSRFPVHRRVLPRCLSKFFTRSMVFATQYEARLPLVAYSGRK